ncbi:MAG: hypothetical protein WCD11_03210 [Solirubrobacteraceae bacterium]
MRLLRMALHPDEFPRVPGGAASLWARLPLQAVFIAWVASAMRHPGSTASRPPGPRLRSADDGAT